MSIDITILAIMISLILAIIGGGVWIGKITERVGNNRFDIEQQRTDNKEEHKEMNSKLDRILQNGKH